MAKQAVEEELRGTVRLRGLPARKVRLIAKREGNAVGAVLRRLVSQGLAHEHVDDEEAST